MYTVSFWRSHLSFVAVALLQLARTVGNPINAYVSGKVTQASRMTTLSSWKSYLGIVADALLHQKPARTVGDPFRAYVPGEVTQVSRMTNVNPFNAYVSVKVTQVSRMSTLSSWKSHLGIVAIALLHQEPARTVGDLFRAYVPGEVVPDVEDNQSTL